MQSTPLELKNSLVRAGAGAGKTRGLVEKVTEIFNQSQGQARIVVTTFTRKATQELKERLILKACEERNAPLLQYVSDPTRLQITTIHGLLNMFLKQVGHLAGLDSGFRIVSEEEGRQLARLALREAVLASPEYSHFLELYGFERLLSMCRAFQTAARESGGLKPATREDLEASRTAACAHWNKTFQAVIAEIKDRTDDASWSEYVSNLQAYLKTWSGETAQLEALPAKPRFSKKQAELEDLHEGVKATVDKFKREMNKPCWDSAHWPTFLEEWRSFAPLAEHFALELNKQKEGQARFEMIDLELKALEILREKPFLGTIYAEAWDFWMIDEYQDTSPLQVEILDVLIDQKPKYVVGDPQQSIYLFRGAEVRVFEDAAEEIRARGGETIELKRNYRTRPDLLLFINDFMRDLSSNFVRMEPREIEGENPRGAEPCVLLYHAADEAQELKGVAARIEELLAGGAKLEDICVLGRTHRVLMDVSRALKGLGYPTHVHAARGFNARREVLDAEALWTFLVNPHDNPNLILLLRSPWFFVTDQHLSEWMKERPKSLWRRLAPVENKPEALLRLERALKDAQELGVARAFEAALVKNAILDLSLANDPAGRKESNLWKLILRARDLEKDGGKSILELNEGESENALESNEGDATSAQEPNCINLMTIHGSKGLEFEHVILPRMGESPRASHTLPLNSDSGSFFFPVWSETEREFIASPLDQGVTARKRERELEEFDRWLYVALTRAKDTLTLTWTERARESWAARSSWFLKPTGEGRTSAYVFELREEMPEPTAYRSKEALTLEPRAPFKTESQTQNRASVTDLIEKNSARTRETSEDILNRWSAQSLGTKIHRALEAAKYGRELEVDGAEGESIGFVLNSTEPPLASIMASGESEWGFQVRTKKQVVEGQVDLWGEFEDKIYVVDYKTGSPKRKEDAFRQLSLYAWALRKFGEARAIEMLVVYPLLKKTETRAFSAELFRFWEVEFGNA